MFFESLYTQEWLPILIYFICSVILASIIFGASYLLANHIPETEKLSSYECGFDPFEDARGTFDVRFYLVAILFILFDLEVAFLFPLAAVPELDLLGVVSSFLFLFILTVGFFFEWINGALDWS